jgi:glycosyltransferase involved in cell wall biosynthesis
VKVLFIARASLYSDRGGDTVQLQRTAECLTQLGAQVDIRLANEDIEYSSYDLLHFFNLSRPADILRHILHSAKPFVLSPICLDYREADSRTRRGVGRLLFSVLSEEGIAFLKALGKRCLYGERISRTYWLNGHRRSVTSILKKAALLLPNSTSEYRRITERFGGSWPHIVIPNGVDPNVFRPDEGLPSRERDLILCVGRIERRKNQLNLIRAVNDSAFRLILIGAPAVHQSGYYAACRRAAGPNVTFLGILSQDQLVSHYSRAQIHALPSWSETTGLSSLEAAVMGCNIVIADKGDTRDYFQDDAFYCDPGSPNSIRTAIEAAAQQAPPGPLRDRVLSEYTWPLAGTGTMNAYKRVLNKKP